MGQAEEGPGGSVLPGLDRAGLRARAGFQDGPPGIGLWPQLQENLESGLELPGTRRKREMSLPQTFKSNKCSAKV